ncbi:hypothetical protein GCM10023201_03430 [Actinomycetospora corticicola]
MLEHRDEELRVTAVEDGCSVSRPSDWRPAPVDRRVPVLGSPGAGGVVKVTRRTTEGKRIYRFLPGSIGVEVASATSRGFRLASVDAGDTQVRPMSPARDGNPSIYATSPATVRPEARRTASSRRRLGRP